MDTETADVIGHHVTTITCVCGNTVSKGGLIQANSQGVPVYIGVNTPVPAELAAWPADEDLYTLCPSCGRVTATRSSKRQEPRPSLSGSTSPLARLPRPTPVALSPPVCPTPDCGAVPERWSLRPWRRSQGARRCCSVLCIPEHPDRPCARGRAACGIPVERGTEAADGGTSRRRPLAFGAATLQCRPVVVGREDGAVDVGAVGRYGASQKVGPPFEPFIWTGRRRMIGA